MQRLENTPIEPWFGWTSVQKDFFAVAFATKATKSVWVLHFSTQYRNEEGYFWQY